MMTVSRNKLTKKDITNMGWLSMVLQFGFNYERMQAMGFCYTMAPYFKKIYGDNTEEVAAAMTNNIDFFNTEMHMATFLNGLILSLEEAGEDREFIRNIKNGLFGPLAGLGDAIFWFTLLPISAAIAVSLNRQNSILGPIVFMVIHFFGAISRIPLGHLGYNLGTNAIDLIRENAASITKAAGVLGVMVVGALIPSYIDFSFPETFVIFDVVPVQGIFDTVLPNILPLGFVLFLYYLVSKKNVNAVKLIFGIIVVSIILSYFGIM